MAVGTAAGFTVHGRTISVSAFLHARGAYAHFDFVDRLFPADASGTATSRSASSSACSSSTTRIPSIMRRAVGRHRRTGRGLSCSRSASAQTAHAPIRTLNLKANGDSQVSIRPEMVFPGRTPRAHPLSHTKEQLMSSIVYIVGLIVIVVAVLSFFGLR